MAIADTRIGQTVVYVDPHGEEHDALVVNTFGPGASAINVAFVSGDDHRQDGFGRQIERQSSVVHQSMQSAHGNYWKHKDAAAA